MSKGKAFVVVGHSCWGKSYTLNALTEKYGGGPKNRSVTINNKKIPVRKRSNDDMPTADELIKFIKKQAEDSRCIIFPLCPNFSKKRQKDTENLLKILRDLYDTSFMVLKKCQRSGNSGEISAADIEKLRAYGDVPEELMVSEKLNEYARADMLKAFVEKWLINHP